MKKHILGLVALALAATSVSCSNDDEILENSIDFSSAYDLKDNPSDPIAHHRYEIYKKYGVPVFFNDTISKTFTGMSHSGDSLFRYETLDFNWSFSGHNKNSVTYTFDYITDPEVQETALQMVEEFLANASKPMRPFSIFLPTTFKVTTTQGSSSPQFFSGFRTLVIPGANKVTSEAIPEFSSTILKSMVKARVTSNEAIVNKFGNISSEQNWYGKTWAALGCVWGVEHKGTYWKPNMLYKENHVYWGITFPTYGDYCVYMSYQTYVYSIEEFEAERAIIFSEIGRFGFINGQSTYEHTNSPKNVSEDLGYYLDDMLNLGSAEFERRYCGADLVQEKYEILRNFIVNELQVQF